MGTNCGISNRRIADTPVAIIDFETTGLHPGTDRVVEASVVRIEPDEDPTIAFDTLINPERKVGGTEIHGITEEDVKDAPRFGDVAGDFLQSLSDCVVAAYNVYFDIRFFNYELKEAGVAEPPHVCLMYMRPMLGLGKRCSLDDACREHNIDHATTHQAGTDALASANLWAHYLSEMDGLDVATFEDLASLKRYKFVRSFANEPFSDSVIAGLPATGTMKPRYQQSIPASTPTTTKAQQSTNSVSSSIPLQSRLHDYWEALKAVVCDLEVTDDELEYLQKKQSSLQLADEQIRSLHAQAFASVINQCVDDKWLARNEQRTLQRLHACLSDLGWAPGE